MYQDVSAGDALVAVDVPDGVLAPEHATSTLPVAATAATNTISFPESSTLLTQSSPAFRANPTAPLRAARRDATARRPRVCVGPGPYLYRLGSFGAMFCAACFATLHALAELSSMDMALMPDMFPPCILSM